MTTRLTRRKIIVAKLDLDILASFLPLVPTEDGFRAQLTLYRVAAFEGSDTRTGSGRSSATRAGAPRGLGESTGRGGVLAWRPSCPRRPRRSGRRWPNPGCGSVSRCFREQGSGMKGQTRHDRTPEAGALGSWRGVLRPTKPGAILHVAVNVAQPRSSPARADSRGKGEPSLPFWSRAPPETTLRIRSSQSSASPNWGRTAACADV